MTPVHHDCCPICGHSHLEPWRLCRDHTVSQAQFAIVRCGACGFRFTQDAPAEADIAPFYQSEDYIAHSNTRRGLLSQLYQLARRMMLGRKRRLVEKLAGRTSGRLLDYGCGTGEFAAHLAAHGWQVLGLEPSEQARHYARTVHGLNVEPPDALFAYEGPPFEVITLWHVLEHVHRLHATLRRLGQVLAPDGLLLVAVPNADAREQDRYAEYWAAWDVPRHLWHFDAQTMGRLLADCGLRIASMQAMPLDAFYVALLSERYQRGRIDWLGALGAGVETWRAARSDVHRASAILYSVRHAAG